MSLDLTVTEYLKQGEYIKNVTTGSTSFLGSTMKHFQYPIAIGDVTPVCCWVG